MSDANSELEQLHDRISQLELESQKSQLDPFHELTDNVAEAFWIFSPGNHDQVSFVSSGYETIWGRKPVTSPFISTGLKIEPLELPLKQK